MSNRTEYSSPRHSTFWRFLLATLVISVITASGALGVAMWVGKGLVNDFQEQAAYTLLRNTSDLIARSSMAVESTYNLELRNARNLLDVTNRNVIAELHMFLDDERNDKLSETQARARAFARISHLETMSPVPHIILDDKGAVLAHADRAMIGRNLFGIRNREGETYYRELLRRSRTFHGRRSAHIVAFPAGVSPDGLLLSALYFPAWGVHVVSETGLAPINRRMEEEHLSALNELKARVREIVVGETGYAFVADGDCNMLAHPNMDGLNMRDYLLSGTNTPMCEALAQTAQRDWGHNKLRYTWNHPGDKPGKTYEKRLWATREPSTGWLVAVTAYEQETEQSLPRFLRAIFLPSIMSIAILGVTLALILRNFLKPVEELTQVCRGVARGDMSQRAPENAPGEIGFLCRRFNAMIQSIGDLRERDARRSRELEVLNTDLERIVGLRTRALERKAHKLEELNTRLRELDQMKSAFLSSVSHELRTPLTSIMGFAKLISKDFRAAFFPQDEKHPREPGLTRRGRRITENLDIIAMEGERLTRLINDVLDLAKIEAGRMDWRDEEFSLPAALEQVRGTMLGSSRRRPGVDIELRVGDGLPMLRADRDRISQLFINLVDNALKFTESGSVTMSVCERDGWLQGAVTDTGEGIRRNELLKVFDKFHQALAGDTLLQKPSGTGLGLAICNNILARYGGMIWAESTYGSGTSIRFELPVDGAAVAEVERLKQEAGSNGGPLVLVVDDEEPIRTFLVDILRGEGYRAITAPDGIMAVEIAEEMQPDLITLDLLMPGMGGQETIRRLRAVPSLAQVPIVVITILGEDEVTGADMLLEKPIDENQFVKSVQRLLHSHAQKDGTTDARYATTAAAHSEEDIEKLLGDGFDGVVVVPENIAKALDLSALARNTGAQVIGGRSKVGPTTGHRTHDAGNGQADEEAEPAPGTGPGNPDNV